MRPMPLSLQSLLFPLTLFVILAAGFVTATPAAATPSASSSSTSPARGGPAAVIFGDPPGANDWDCQPTSRRPVPVVLVHGTFGDRKSLLEALSRDLVDDGFCVYSLDYGRRGTQDIRDSAQELADFVDRVLIATGAVRVSLVGHSQGGLMPRYFIKHLGGDELVEDLVGLAPSNHGTTIVGPPNPLTSSVLGGFCRSCVQQAAGSDFLAELNNPDETPGPVDYTQITTRYDEVVVPHTSGYLTPGPRSTNITLQDKCPGALAEHILIPTDRAVRSMVVHAVTTDGPAHPDFRPTC